MTEGPINSKMMAPLAADDAVSVILKVRGETCNIDCLYCYEKRKEAPGGARISVKDLNSLRDLFGDRPLALEIHGGEPLTLPKAEMRALLREINRTPNIVRVSIQTNGLLLDDEWLSLFRDERPDIQFGVSLDGSRQGNAWRLDYRGRQTFDGVVEGLRLLERNGVRTGIICAVTPLNVDNARENLAFLMSFSNVVRVSFVPVFDQHVRTPTASTAPHRPESRLSQARHISSAGPAWGVDPGSYAEFVLAATEEWMTSGGFRRVALEPTVDIIRKLRGLRSASCHFSDLKCNHVFTLYPDGRFGSCDELPWPASQIGRIQNMAPGDVSLGQRRLLPLQAASSLWSKCEACSYRTTCGGGCTASRLRFRSADNEDAYCASRARMIDGIASLLAIGRCEPSVTWIDKKPNSMADVEDFRRLWDSHVGRRRPLPNQQRSAFGNVNIEGVPGGRAPSADLIPTDLQWADEIEAGIRPVVNALVQGLGAMTYDSCEGHDYGGLCPNSLAFVGVLPRDVGEARSIADSLTRAAESMSLPPELGTAILHSEGTGRVFETLEIVFGGNPESTEYWKTVGTRIESFANVLANERGNR